MARTPSTMKPLGSPAPDFSLLDTATGTQVSRDDFRGSPGLLVMFICNHCPFVVHIRDGLAKLAAGYQAQGLKVVAISSNDVAHYPQDGPDLMAKEHADAGYTFPYLYDASQDVARAYHAACTPDFFLFDGDQRLVYRGQLDSSRPGNDIPVTGEDLTRAVDALISGDAPLSEQRPSIGCNIKWKPGTAPNYFG